MGGAEVAILRGPAQSGPVGRFVIEVKLDAGKSGEASEEAGEEAPDLASADQLHKYWQGLCGRNDSCAAWVDLRRRIQCACPSFE